MFSQWQLYLSIAIAVSVIALALSAAQNAQERDRMIRAMETQAEQIDTNEVRIRRLLGQIETLVDQLEEAGIEPQHKEEEGEKEEEEPRVEPQEEPRQEPSDHQHQEEEETPTQPQSPNNDPDPAPDPEPEEDSQKPEREPEPEKKPEPEEEEPEEENDTLNDTLESFPDPFEVIPETGIDSPTTDTSVSTNARNSRDVISSGGRSRPCNHPFSLRIWGSNPTTSINSRAHSP